MKNGCIDIGTLQAFLDNELVHSMSATVADHVGACDNCALMLAEAEEESALVFSALDREFNTLVPTQRLWGKINDSIAAERRERSIGQRIWAFLALAFANPSLGVAAGLLIVAGLAAIFFIESTPRRGANEIADLATSTKTSASVPAVPAAPSIRQDSVPDKVVDERAPLRPHIENAAYGRPIRPSSVDRKPVALPSAVAAMMPGEESYIRTISTLKKTVDEQKDGVLRPSERVAFERDMAVVDDTISKMRDEVKKNPRNGSAKQVLYNSYQNKIDLLNSVAQKEELVASLK